MVILGGIIGALVGLIIIASIAGVLGLAIAFPAWLSGIIGGALASILGLVSGLGAGRFLVVAAFATAIAYIFAYVIAAIFTAPLIPAGGGRLANDPTENLMRGFMIGLTAAMDFGLLTFRGAGGLGVLLGLIVLLAVTPLSVNAVYQGILGWSGWLLPMAYVTLVTPLGFLLFLLNLIFHFLGFPITSLRLDLTTGTIESGGGIVAGVGVPLNGFIAFNLGNFTFLGTAAPGGFAAPSVSAHETGHTLTVAAFSGVEHWCDAIDENVFPTPAGLTGRGAAAYGEMVPESHIPRAGRPFVGVWS